MEGTNVYYVVKKGALPEVLLKVVEANRLIDTQKVCICTGSSGYGRNQQKLLL